MFLLFDLSLIELLFCGVVWFVNLMLVFMILYIVIDDCVCVVFVVRLVMVVDLVRMVV